MTFPDHHFQQVALKEAAAMTAAYRMDERGLGLRPLMVWRQILDEILTQPVCEGIRLYPALNLGQPTLVLVGTDADLNDLWEGPLAEELKPCPPYCSEPNSLNGGKPAAAASRPDVFGSTTGDEHRVSLDDASSMIAALGARDSYAEVEPGTYGRGIIDAILGQPGCTGLRFYPGRDDDGRLTVVAVGVDGAMNDIWKGVLGQQMCSVLTDVVVDNPLNGVTRRPENTNGAR